jgi:hypothetical protein
MRCFSMLMAVVLMWSSTAGAAGPGWVGSLRSTGIVLANAVPMPDGSTVRSGDRIACGPDSVAFITSPGQGRVELRSDSAALLAPDHVQLERGIVAASRLPITVSGYTIRPVDPDHAWYTVASRQGQLLVAAHQGNVLISSAAGAAPILLAQGSQAERPAAGQPPTNDPWPDQEAQAPLPAPQRRRHRRAGAVAGASTGGWTIAGFGHAASVALLIGAGAAVAVVSVGAAVALSDQTPSPSH